MAVRLEGTTRRYIGGSADRKPTPGYQPGDGTTLTASDLPPGSSFLESDTGDLYRWNGTNWLVVDPLTNIDLSPLVLAIDRLFVEVVALRLGMIEAGACKRISTDDAAAFAAD